MTCFIIFMAVIYQKRKHFSILPNNGRQLNERTDNSNKTNYTPECVSNLPILLSSKKTIPMTPFVIIGSIFSYFISEFYGVVIMNVDHLVLYP